jgi:hypothetical protein
MDMRTGFGGKTCKLRDRIEDVSKVGAIILKWILRKWTGAVWFRIVTSVGILMYIRFP